MLRLPAEVEELFRIRILRIQIGSHRNPSLAVCLRSEDAEGRRAESAGKGEREAVQVADRDRICQLEREQVVGGSRIAVGCEVVRCPAGFGRVGEDRLGVLRGA